MTEKDSLPAIGALLFSVITLGLVRTRALAKARIKAAAATQTDTETAEEELIQEGPRPLPDTLNDEERHDNELNAPVIATTVDTTPSLWQIASTNIYNLVTWPWRKAVETYTHIKESAAIAHDRYVRLRNASEEVMQAAFKLNEALFKFNDIATEIQPSLPPAEKVIRGFKYFSALFTVLFFRNTIATAASVAVKTVAAATVLATKNPKAVVTAAVMAPPMLIAYKADQQRESSVFGKIRDTVTSSCTNTLYAAKRMVIA